MSKTACYGCTYPVRHVGCHIDCKQYLDAVNDNAVINERRRKEEAIYGSIVAHNNECRARYYRSHR